MLGFPDGFIAEREAAEEPLATYLGWFFVAILSYRTDVKRPAIYACVLIVLVAAACGALDLHYRSTMMDSRGG
jgi:hypothetical protein